jgi:hypothetical protein
LSPVTSWLCAVKDDVCDDDVMWMDLGVDCQQLSYQEMISYACTLPANMIEAQKVYLLH